MQLLKTHRSGILHFAVVASYFGLLSILFTLPLITHFRSAIPGGGIDEYLFFWEIKWLKTTIFDEGHLLLQVDGLNYPDGWNLTYHVITFTAFIVTVPMSVLTGEEVAYNSYLLLSCVLSGLALYYWVKNLTYSSGAALIAGTLFAFSNYRIKHMQGHLNLVGTHWIVLYFWALHITLQAIAQQRLTRRQFALTAGLLGLVGLTSMYYLYMSLMITACFLVGFLLFGHFHLVRKKFFWKNLIPLAIVLAIVTFISISYLLIGSQGSKRSLELVRSSALTDYFIPYHRNRLWEWKYYFQRNLGVESYSYLGLVTLIGMGLVLPAYRHLEQTQRNFVKLSFFVALIGVYLSLGINQEPQWLSGKLYDYINMPDGLKTGLGKIFTPNYYLYKYLPFYDRMRSLNRFGIFVLLFACLNAGLGLSWLFQKVQAPYRIIIIALVCLLTLADLAPSATPYSSTAPRDVDLWLAEQKDGEPIVFLPYGEMSHPKNTYYASFYDHPRLGAPFLGSFPTQQYDAIKYTIIRFPDIASLQLLQDYGIHYLFIRNDFELIPPTPNLFEIFGLEQGQIFTDYTVYTLPPSAINSGDGDILQVNQTSYGFNDYRAVSNLYPPEYLARTGVTGQWMGPDPELNLTLTANWTGPTVVNFCLTKSVAPHLLEEIRLEVNHQAVQLNKEATDTCPFLYTTTTAISIEDNQVNLLFSVPETIIADTLHQNNDQRQLGVHFDWVQLNPLEAN